MIAIGSGKPLDFLKSGDIRFPDGEDASMKMGNPFKKRSEKKAATAPAPRSTYTAPPSRLDTDLAQQAVFYTPPSTPSRPDDCGTSSHHSTPSHTPHHSGGSYGGHSSHTSHDSGSSHSSFGSHDSGSSGCDGGGGF
jgi:hypothetical protein